MCKCLYCYQPLAAGEKDFHARCSRRFFGLTTPPQFTTVGLWGTYIMKPQSDHYAELPEIEDLTMHLAELCKLTIVPHTLMRMADGSLCYLTRRIDRTATGEKIHMEDMCQLTNRQTEHKYKCSYEYVAETIQRYSVVPQMDVVTLLDILIFCFLTGNNDMHLKNFSLYEPLPGEIRLSPAYDLLNVALVHKRDAEETALKLNGKRAHICQEDFVALAQSAGIDTKIVVRLIGKYQKLLPKVEDMVHMSFLSPTLQEQYIQLFKNRLQSLCDTL